MLVHQRVKPGRSWNVSVLHQANIWTPTQLTFSRSADVWNMSPPWGMILARIIPQFARCDNVGLWAVGWKWHGILCWRWKSILGACKASFHVLRSLHVLRFILLIIWVCLKIVYPKTQWFCWSLSLLNGYFIGNIPNIFRQTHMACPLHFGYVQPTFTNPPIEFDQICQGLYHRCPAATKVDAAQSGNQSDRAAVRVSGSLWGVNHSNCSRARVPYMSIHVHVYI